MGELFKFVKQESGQCFLAAVGAMYIFWDQGAPEWLLRLVFWLAVAYVVGEKLLGIVKAILAKRDGSFFRDE